MYRGKSFLLTTVYLWCIVNGKKAKAAAPTGIAATNVEIEGTDVAATTIHAMLDLDCDLKCKLDFAKLGHPKVQSLMSLEVLFLDEVSMIDVHCWDVISRVFEFIDHAKRPRGRRTDSFGQLHVILFGDFKQLPPATTQPPFFVLPEVHNKFDFRVLREHRRVFVDAERAQESEEFHEVLNDIAWGDPTERVKKFIIEAYVRGAYVGCAENCAFEGSTSVFTKRRYRDRWNRTMVRRISKVRNHTLKVKGRVRSRGASGQAWFNESRTQLARRHARTQSPWNLHLAGDWHSAHETGRHVQRPHMMRVMLVSNLAVEQRFANGTQGRLMYWNPPSTEKGKSLYSSRPELLARFIKESALHKREVFPDVDHIDVTARQETLTSFPGQPGLLQLPIVPAYALTVHKTQALSMKEVVRGCLEGAVRLVEAMLRSRLCFACVLSCASSNRFRGLLFIVLVCHNSGVRHGPGLRSLLTCYRPSSSRTHRPAFTYMLMLYCT